MNGIKIERLGREELARRGVWDWPIWTKEASRFDWFYDAEEQCYLLEGEVTIETSEGKLNIQAGDFVTFPTGLSCVWEIHRPVRKHYFFPS